ncbi:MAG: hypothetical protein CM15mP113_3410 [Pseudomonadota bacterium]|nr:MAG: hypothetical protein CM15mP113_3410 [Pseudomonadota bacterium]
MFGIIQYCVYIIYFIYGINHILNMGNLQFTILLGVAIGLFVFNKWENRKKKESRGPLQRSPKGKVIFWNVSESEMLTLWKTLQLSAIIKDTHTKEYL